MAQFDVQTQIEQLRSEDAYKHRRHSKILAKYPDFRVVLFVIKAGVHIREHTSAGRLLIWDAVFPARTDERHLYIRYPLHVKLPGKEINTGYGVHFHERQAAEHFLVLAAKTGFEVISRKDEKGWFALELRKPA